jgi:hypothetical protein
VEKLFRGVRENMPKGMDYRCTCLTDDPLMLPTDVEARPVLPGITGWWNKALLFHPAMFKSGDRVVYFDLDTLILGDLTDIVSYAGKFAIQNDFFRPERAGSSCMAWEAGTLDHIWNTWDASGRPSFDPRGDQFWIETMQPEADRWQDMLPGQFISYKVDCWHQGKIPDGARVLCFHGHPRNHECRAPFIQSIWQRPLTEAA